MVHASGTGQRVEKKRTVMASIQGQPNSNGAQMFSEEEFALYSEDNPNDGIIALIRPLPFEADSPDESIRREH